MSVSVHMYLDEKAQRLPAAVDARPHCQGFPNLHCFTHFSASDQLSEQG